MGDWVHKMNEIKFKQNQIVIFDDPPGKPSNYPWKIGEHLLYLGEIEQMPGHCIIVNKAGRVFWGWHTDNFRNPTEDEL